MPCSQALIEEPLPLLAFLEIGEQQALHRQQQRKGGVAEAIAATLQAEKTETNAEYSQSLLLQVQRLLQKIHQNRNRVPIPMLGARTFEPGCPCAS